MLPQFILEGQFKQRLFICKSSLPLFFYFQLFNENPHKFIGRAERGSNAAVMEK